jgi:hypothetical protein
MDTGLWCSSELLRPRTRPEALLSLLYAVQRNDFNSAGTVCNCRAHRFGNAADHPNRPRAYDTDMTDA